MTVIQPAGNFYDKYGSRNPIVRILMNGFIREFDSLSRQARVTAAIEVGCGEGELSLRLARQGIAVRAYDISEDVIVEARKRASSRSISIDFEVASLDQMRNVATAPLVVCCEVLEHLEHPHEGLEALESLTTNWLLASVPREPIWRILNLARGRYARELGNTPGHVNHWSKREFIAFVETRFQVVEIRCPLPWTMLLCRRR